MRPPDLAHSTEQERFEFVKTTYRCIADCDMCGICQALKGKTPEVAFDDYIKGREDYLSVAARYR